MTTERRTSFIEWCGLAFGAGMMAALLAGAFGYGQVNPVAWAAGICHCGLGVCVFLAKRRRRAGGD